MQQADRVPFRGKRRSYAAGALAIYGQGDCMLTKICPQCGRRLKLDAECPCHVNRHHIYDAARRDRKAAAFYHDKQWHLLTQSCGRRASWIDQYAYAVHHRLDHGTLSHHILTIHDRPDLRYSLENLLYVSAKSHAEIHKIYDSSPDAKAKLQARLKQIKRGWRG